jgi:hypothetical protein
VLGDLSSALHVAVLVPGSDVDVARFDRTVLPIARSLHEVAQGHVTVIA